MGWVVGWFTLSTFQCAGAHPKTSVVRSLSPRENARPYAHPRSSLYPPFQPARLVSSTSCTVDHRLSRSFGASLVLKSLGHRQVEQGESNKRRSPRPRQATPDETRARRARLSLDSRPCACAAARPTHTRSCRHQSSRRPRRRRQRARRRSRKRRQKPSDALPPGLTLAALLRPPPRPRRRASHARDHPRRPSHRRARSPRSRHPRRHQRSSRTRCSCSCTSTSPRPRLRSPTPPKPPPRASTRASSSSPCSMPSSRSSERTRGASRCARRSRMSVLGLSKRGPGADPGRTDHRELHPAEPDEPHKASPHHAPQSADQPPRPSEADLGLDGHRDQVSQVRDLVDRDGDAGRRGELRSEILIWGQIESGGWAGSRGARQAERLWLGALRHEREVLAEDAGVEAGAVELVSVVVQTTYACARPSPRTARAEALDL